MMKNLDIRREPLPEDMQVLLRDYPREIWPNHPNFVDATKNWMGAHQMFRKLAQITKKDTENYLDKKRDAHDFARRLSYYGDLLVRNLHGHHHWEDHAFFPELSVADPRFDQGLATLEADHEILDEVLDNFTSHANRVIQLIQLDEKNARDDAGHLHAAGEAINDLLDRHLEDEENLIVPIILHHKLRG